MKKVLMLVALLVPVCLVSSLMAAQTLTVTGKITRGDLGASSKGAWMANPDAGKFTVPAGKTAKSFKASNGSNADNKAWSIVEYVNGRNVEVYAFQEAPTNWNATFQKFMSRAAQETPVPLGNLTLGPGTYLVYVSGTIGAKVDLTLTIVP